MFACGTSARMILGILQHIYIATPKIQKIWVVSDIPDRDLVLQQSISKESELREMIQAGEVSSDSNIWSG
jgi:hypothetical protein